MSSKTSKTITTYPVICWLLVSDNGHSTIWHSVGLRGLIVVIKSPGTYWIWVNCCSHSIGSDESIAVIRSQTLCFNGSKDVCILSGICGTDRHMGCHFVLIQFLDLGNSIAIIASPGIVGPGDSTVWRSIFCYWFGLASWRYLGFQERLTLYWEFYIRYMTLL